MIIIFSLRKQILQLFIVVSTMCVSEIQNLIFLFISFCSLFFLLELFEEKRSGQNHLKNHRGGTLFCKTFTKFDQKSFVRCLNFKYNLCILEATGNPSSLYPICFFIPFCFLKSTKLRLSLLKPISNFVFVYMLRS